jgi:hypothetical protein
MNFDLGLLTFLMIVAILVLVILLATGTLPN